ncbi:efflux RND transporter periplasmic adaptor subunit [Thalassotalea atypica]|uniref:efflux RND transporter periplasmic adaptor subunit n=1 Tax=Thalassotalea atypica TaxID=2054316 RepID=UPI002572273B|nr:efflux RND transporter periplasmic adaptor subunit [Thalassotalea atypica]
MARKKQIIVPIVILAAGVLAFVGFSAMKKPPEEKAEVDNTPIVAVEQITVESMQLTVKSHGIVMPKYETRLVSQISGEIVELSEAFVRGGFVKKGQLLARIDPSDYEAALLDAQANHASSLASLETERAKSKVAETEWKRITHSAPTELSLRKPQLAQELAHVKSAKATILRAQRNLERTEIRAPYDAMIESRHVGLGSFVTVGSDIGKVLGTAIAEVRLPVADNQLKFLIDQGQQAQVQLSGTFSGTQRFWSAHVARNEGVVDNKSRMGYLVAEIKDPYGLNESKTELRFGSYVNAAIFGIEVAQASVIPNYLISDGRIALLNDESKLHFAEVEIIRQDGANSIISNGLSTGDRMITSALDYPINGMALALPKDEEQTPEQSVVDTQIASIQE